MSQQGHQIIIQTSIHFQIIDTDDDEGQRGARPQPPQLQKHLPPLPSQVPDHGRNIPGQAQESTSPPIQNLALPYNIIETSSKSKKHIAGRAEMDDFQFRSKSFKIAYHRTPPFNQSNRWS